MGKSAILSIRIVSNAKDAERGIDRTGRSLRKLDKSANNTGVALSRMYRQFDDAARAATRVGALTVAAQALTVKAAVAGKALAPLVGLVGAVPGIAGAAGAAMATFKVATAGFGDAVAAAGERAEKFAEATKGMPPSMVAAVRATAGLSKEFAKVQKSVQSAFWQGLDRDS